MKIFNIIFAILFVIFAALQYNDPDPFIWMPIYLYAAVLCWMASRNKFYPKLMMAGIAVYALYAIYLFFENNGVMDWMTEHDAYNIACQMKASTPWIEDTRDFFGLCLTSFSLLMNYLYAKRKKIA